MKKLLLILAFLVLGCASVRAEEDYSVDFSSSNFTKEREFIYQKNKDEFDNLKKMNTTFFIGIDKYDINNDGLDDFIASIQSTFHCGAGPAGCPTEIYISDSNGSWNLLHGFSSLGKVNIQADVSDGYHNIKVYGGTQHLPKDTVWQWNGDFYERKSLYPYKIDFSNNKFFYYQGIIFERQLAHYQDFPERMRLKKDEIFIDTIDLNNDKKDEIFAYEANRGFCDHNVCGISVFQKGKKDVLKVILSTTTASNIIKVLPSQHNGYHDIEFISVSGESVIWRWNGREYYENKS